MTFANANDCRNAEAECGDKMINGRRVRAEIGISDRMDRHRDDGYRGRGGRYDGKARLLGFLVLTRNDTQTQYVPPAPFLMIISGPPAA